MSISKLIVLYLLPLCCLGASPSWGISPDEVLVVYNERTRGAQELALYYMEQRAIPNTNILEVSMPQREVVDRNRYNEQLREPVLEKLMELEQRGISTIVLIYGLPLKVLSPKLSDEDQNIVERLRKQRDNLSWYSIDFKKKSQGLTKQIDLLIGANKKASVDSELSLVKAGEYPLESWIPNPYFLDFQHKKGVIRKDDVLLVARIDGPDIETAYRIIDDSIAVEKTGLRGIGYFDARWEIPKGEKLSGYALYDVSIHKSADAVSKKMKVVMDEKEVLFSENSAPEAALYCGWYSYGKYIDSFTWVRGAVGYHIASAECTTLKKDSTVWCRRMLQEGVAATIGPVYEPYVEGFPLPEIFFTVLTEGDFDLGESYLISLPFLSWQMVLVGDPLYRPFASTL